MNEPTTLLLPGDCFDVLTTIDDASVDAVVTDPPYGINFMGKAWDGKAIEEAASKARDVSGLTRLTGSKESTTRKPVARTGSAFQNRAGEAGAYDFSAKGTRAFQEWCERWAAECFRILKPGGHLLAFGGPRTYHRLAAGIEDAGFEIRDTLCWLYGSGFPKSLDISKAIDKAAGVERTETIGVKLGHEDFVERTDAHAAGGRSDGWERPWRDDPEAVERSHMRFAPATVESARWDGWGTALKPGFEPIVVARKPPEGTVASNVLAYGTGGLNIDGCRIGTSKDVPASPSLTDSELTYGSYGVGDGRVGSGFDENIGRWPANVLLTHGPDCVLIGTRTVASDGHYPSARPGGVQVGTVGHSGQENLVERFTAGETIEEWECGDGCPIAILDEQAPNTGGGGFPGAKGGIGQGLVYGTPGSGEGLRDTGRIDANGGASRFFYCAKVSRAERSAGLEEFTKRPILWSSGEQNPGSFQADGTDRSARNHHPTVKPVDLMRWLVRLVTPPGGTVLDPFLGSGTTGIAAALEDFSFVGIEREPDYLEIATARIAWWSEHRDAALDFAAVAAERERRAQAGQLDLFSIDSEAP